MTIKYYLPWWPSDYIWKEWTREHDLGKKHNNWTKTYLWDLMPDLLDGILISRWPVGQNKAKNIRKKLRYEGMIIGDSGAHSYRNMDEPPYSCEELLKFYADGCFDFGMILDVVAAPWVRPGGLSRKSLEKRVRTTIQNAEACLEIHARNRYSYGLIGVVQGWDVNSYVWCARQILKLGFDYIAIAGQRNLKLIKSVIKEVQSVVSKLRREIKIHVLGSGSPKLIEYYLKMGIYSYDSATWLRQAWMSGVNNYFIADGLQHRAFRATRVGLDNYDVRKLKWSKKVDCGCPICRELGQEVLLFRGRQRNFRRGFHNVYQYVRLLDAHRFSKQHT